MLSLVLFQSHTALHFKQLLSFMHYKFSFQISSTYFFYTITLRKNTTFIKYIYNTRKLIIINNSYSRSGVININHKCRHHNIRPKTKSRVYTNFPFYHLLTWVFFFFTPSNGVFFAFALPILRSSPLAYSYSIFFRLDRKDS